MKFLQSVMHLLCTVSLFSSGNVWGPTLTLLQIQSNLGSRTPRIMNNSVYEQIFRTQSVSDDVLCLELRTRKPSTSWSNKLGVSALAIFVEE